MRNGLVKATVHISGGFEYQTCATICDKTYLCAGRRAFKCFAAIFGSVAVAAFEYQFVSVALHKFKEFFAGYISRTVAMRQMSW